MIEIRQSNPSDASAIARVREESWRAAYRGIVPDDFLDGMDATQWADGYRRFLDNPSERLVSIVAEQDGTIVGMVAAGPNRDNDTPYSAELFMIYLLPGHWRRGIGLTLVGATARSLIDLGLSSMVVWVLAENWPARRFYEVLGGRYFRRRLTSIAVSPLQEVSYGWPELSILISQNQPTFETRSSLSSW